MRAPLSADHARRAVFVSMMASSASYWTKGRKIRKKRVQAHVEIISQQNVIDIEDE